MEFFTGINSALDEIGRAENLVKADPRMADQLDAIKDLRDRGDPLGSHPHMRRVASFSAPLHLLNTILEPDFLKDKRKFYEYLDSHPEWCTYDRRAAMARTGATFHGWAPDEVPAIGGSNADVWQAPEPALDCRTA